MYKYLFILLAITTSGFALPGSFQLSFTRSEIVADSLPLLVDHFQMFTIGSSIQLYPQFNMMFATGYGSPSRSANVSAPDSIIISDIESRVWIIKAGVDYQLHKEAPFFVRAASGSIYMERDYCLSVPGSSIVQKFSDGEWEPIISIGLGSKLPIDFMPLLTNVEFLLSAEWIGADATVISGGVGFGI